MAERIIKLLLALNGPTVLVSWCQRCSKVLFGSANGAR